jgi:hypothetical protein
MRSALRTLTVVLSAAVLASCMDMLQGTAPGARASLTIVPRFSESASLASATLAQAGLTYNSVRIVIVRPASDTLKDTTIAFSPTSPEVTLELSVVAIPSETLEAGVEFKDGNNVIFSGKATTKAISPTASATATPVEVIVSYSGTGATTAVVAIQPGAGSYSSTNTTQFTAKAFDAANTELAGTPIFWSLSDDSKATISATGLLTPKGQRGTVEVTATAANGVSKTITVQLASAAAGLRVVQGAGQKGPPGSELPMEVIVELFAADGLPAASAGQTITFSAVTAGASITPTTTTLDADARAKAKMTVGTSAATTYIFKAKVGTDSVLWGGSAAPGTPTHFVPSGPTTIELIAGQVPDPVPTLRVADAQENPVPGQFLQVTVTQGGATQASNTFIVPADSIGLLEVYKVAPTRAGTYTILFELDDPNVTIPSITYTVTVKAGAAAKLAFTQQPPSTVASGSSGTVKVEIQDSFGNRVASPAPSNVNLAIDPAGPTGWNISGTGSVTPVEGVASFTIQINTTSGAKSGVRLQAVGANLPAVLSAAFNITVP